MVGLAEVSHLQVCRACLTLRGPFYDNFNRCDRVQPCGCDADQPPWNGYDYNTFAELCRGCAAEIVHSGSKWSPFFCDACKARVLTYNESVGSCVIPLGRHSLMNGVVLHAAAARRRKVAQFVDGLFGSLGRSDGLLRFRRERIGRVLKSLSEPAGAVPVPTYLACAKTGSENGDVVFAALVSVMTGAEPTMNG
jgi:hypothetical protein